MQTLVYFIDQKLMYSLIISRKSVSLRADYYKCEYKYLMYRWLFT